MIIKGFQPTTLIDYPGKIACIVFVTSCNFRCGFCYNKKLVDDTPELNEISQEEILEFLEKRKVLLDGVVITGGEPTLHNDLPDFIAKVKDKGFSVKLDTNGTNPEMVKKLIDDKLIDYIAMDIKNSPEKYSETTNVKVNMEKINETIKLIRNSGLDYEFRTTAFPRMMTKEDFLKIGEWLKGSKKYCIQQFKSMGDLIDINFLNEKMYSEPDLNEIKKLLEPYFDKIEVRI